MMLPLCSSLEHFCPFYGFTPYRPNGRGRPADRAAPSLGQSRNPGRWLPGEVQLPERCSLILNDAPSICFLDDTFTIGVNAMIDAGSNPEVKTWQASPVVR